MLPLILDYGIPEFRIQEERYSVYRTNGILVFCLPQEQYTGIRLQEERYTGIPLPKERFTDFSFFLKNSIPVIHINLERYTVYGFMTA